MQMQNEQSLIVPFFRIETQKNEAKSKEAGRPIYDDIEVVEVRIAGERNYAPVFPAHSMWRRIDGEEVTYAQRWAEEYDRFKEGRDQVASGTPISELPFLTEGDRKGLRSLKVYTAEALASLDGKNLKVLGASGREWKDAAAAYLTAAKDASAVARLQAQVDELKAQLAAGGTEPVPVDDDKAALKSRIEELTGSRPRGNPSVETLREMLADLGVDA